MSKIAVSSQGKSLESQVDPRFGRAAYFLVVDDQDGSFVVLDNSVSRDMSSGAGIQAAEAVARAGAKTVLSGLVGPKALQALEAAGLKVVQGAKGSVGEALAAFKQGAPFQDKPALAGGGMGRGGQGMGRGRGMGGGGRGGGACRR